MDRKSNLILNNKRTHEELVEMGRRGGIASGIARRRRREENKGLKAILRRCSYNQMMHAWFEVEKERKAQREAQREAR